jgi:hypothetical protein
VGTFKKKIYFITTFLLLLGLIWYHIPQKYERSYDVSTVEGELARLKLDITYYRTLISQTRIEGRIELNGKSYKSFYQASNNSLLTNISKKIKGEIAYPWFLDEEFLGPASDADTLIVLSENKMFKEISLMRNDMKDISTIQVFYGPAKNSHEAEVLVNKFFKNQ